MAVAETKIGAELRKPATAPNPVSEDRIHDRANATAVNHEGGKPPPLGAGARRDGRGGVHKDHLKEKERKGCGVITHALQQKPLVSEEAKRLAEQIDRPFAIKPAVIAH